MGKRDRYRDDPDPETRRWGSTYRSFPGVEECVRVYMDRNTRGALLDLITYELSENASEQLDEIIAVYHKSDNESVRTLLLMALEIAALPASVEFLAEALQSGGPTHKRYAKRALEAIDTKEARRVLWEAGNANPR